MEHQINLGPVEQVPPGEVREFVVAGRIIAIARVGDLLYALDGICAHQGGPLGKGALEGCTLTCPWHGWQYDVREGTKLQSQGVRQQTFPVSRENGQIIISIDSESS